MSATRKFSPNAVTVNPRTPLTTQLPRGVGASRKVCDHERNLLCRSSSRFLRPEASRKDPRTLTAFSFLITRAARPPPLRGNAVSKQPDFNKLSSMSTQRSNAYNTGITEGDVESKAHEDGQAGSLDPANVGENSHPHAADHLVEGHEAAVSTIGHDMRDDVQIIDAQLNVTTERINESEAAALLAIDTHTSASRHALVQNQRMRAAGVSPPGRFRTIKYIGLLLLLFFGELALVAVAFQVMGLPDKPWIPGLVFTDDLHLAGLSVVLGLVVLAHTVGHHARSIAYALEVRRRAGSSRDEHPKPAAFDYLWTGLTLLAAIGGTIALSAIRASYLQTIGSEPHQIAFTVVQLLLLAAAVGLGFAHANPELDQWNDIEKKLTEAVVERDNAVSKNAEIVGEHNSLLDLRLATVAKAGHHVGANAANVRGQTSAYKRRYILDQHEPVREKLFADHLTPSTYKDGELLARLVGITTLPEFSKGSTKKVLDGLTAEREELAALQARIDQIAIRKLELPEVDEAEAIGKTVPDGSLQHEAPTPAERPANVVEPALHPVPTSPDEGAVSPASAQTGAGAPDADLANERRTA